METGISPEKRRVRNLAETYRVQGYTVLEEPSQEQLPEFLSNFRPALIVHKEHESVVVEVVYRASIPQNSRVTELARTLRTQPGWSFKLVLMETGEQLLVSEAAVPFDKEDILNCIAEAENLLAGGYAEAALLRAWASADATVRMMTIEEGYYTDLYTSPHLISLAAWEGIISEDDYRFLGETMCARDTYVNGFTLPGFDAAQAVHAIIKIAKDLLEYDSATEPA